MSLLVYALPGNEYFADGCAAHLSAAIGNLAVHRFPDGETLVRIDTPPQAQHVALVCSLARPDERILPLLFAAAAARDQGARSVGLVAPYLAYLRQDRVFHRGEALTSATFARLLSAAFDWLATVDPHLHRYHALSDVYTIPAEAVSAAPAMADWIQAHVHQPLLIGPDEESRQWVAAIGDRAGAPYTTLTKRRLGDRSVRIALPDLKPWRGLTPVLIDDIISSGRTMAEAVAALTVAAMRPAVCIAAHGVFAGNAYHELKAAGAGRIVTTNTVPHSSNRVDVTAAVSTAIHALWRDDRVGARAPLETGSRVG